MEKIIVEPDDAIQKKSLEEFLQQKGIKFKQKRSTGWKNKRKQ